MIFSFPHVDFSTRTEGKEWMDDPTMDGEDLYRALRNLRWINRLLGGYRASFSVLGPLLRRRPALEILDVGTGLGDYLAPLVTTGCCHKTRVRATGIDLNPRTVGYGRAWLDRTLPPSLRPQAQIEVADALRLPYEDDSFDVAHAALFLHHFHGREAEQLLREMDRVSRRGIVVNDLHRHPLAYAGIWLLTRLLPVSPMVRHDGPLSVRRGFRRHELMSLFDSAGLESPLVRWHWPFRWTCSTLSPHSDRSRTSSAKPSITSP